MVYESTKEAFKDTFVLLAAKYLSFVQVFDKPWLESIQNLLIEDLK